MIVKTKEQAAQLAKDKGYNLDVTDRFKHKMRCKCYPAHNLWRTNRTTYYIGGMIEDGVWELLTIIYCDKCGEDYIKENESTKS